MTGHDLDLEACKRIPHPVAKVLVAEVESLRAKLAAAEQMLAYQLPLQVAAANQAEAKLAAAEQERDAYKRAKAENDERFMLRYMRAEAALEAVREVLDSSDVDGPEHDDWVWLDEASRKLAGISKILAAAEQDEPTGCLGDCGWKHCRPPCPQAGQPEPTPAQP